MLVKLSKSTKREYRKNIRIEGVKRLTESFPKTDMNKGAFWLLHLLSFIVCANVNSLFLGISVLYTYRTSYPGQLAKINLNLVFNYRVAFSLESLKLQD